MLANTSNILQMCSFDTNKSTKGASKLRRDLINAEIANLRDLLPLPSSTRQRLSQLQLMALVCVYVRKANYFQHVFRKRELPPESPIPHFGFSKALSGFLMMMTQNGKLLYISDNAAEYLGHSMEDLLIHGDSVYDIIEKQDHQAIQAELMRSPNPLNLSTDTRIFLCRMNVSRNARRQMRFGDQKVVLVEGHFVSFLPLCSRNEPVFLATCTPVAMPETRECVVQGSTTVFTSIHSMDMKFLHVDVVGECHLGYSKSSLQGISWYELVHWEHLREAQSKHRLITQSEQERSCIILLRLQEGSGRWLWVHVVLQIKDGADSSQQSVIVCTNQILSEKEAAVMRANSWLYQYYSLHSKMHYGLSYETQPTRLPTYYTAAMMPSPYGPATAEAVPHAPYPLHPGQPLNGAHPTVLQYGGVPYTSLPADPEPAARWPPKRPPADQDERHRRGQVPSSGALGETPGAAYFTGGPGGGGPQVFAATAVSYSQLLSLRAGKAVEEGEALEQSLTPTSTEDVSAIISMARPPFLPIASVLTESTRLLSDANDEFGRREDCRTFLSSGGRFELPYARYGSRFSETYPTLDYDPRRRFGSPDACRPPALCWPSGGPAELLDCYPCADKFESPAPTYQELSSLRHELRRREEELRRVPDCAPEGLLEPYPGAPRLVTPAKTPSPHSRASSDC